MALATLERVSFAYPDAGPALRDVSLELHAGERVALLGPSGSGKSTLLRALAGLVPHFHGGRFTGRVTVDGRDTRAARPAELAGTVATVFQDPEDQVVLTRVANEVAFGLENVGTQPDAIAPRTASALAEVGAAHLAQRRTDELSGGELQRVCLAAALALRPRLLLLDEPTSQLDPDGAAAFLDAVAALGGTVVLSEQRAARTLELAERVLFVEEGRLALDAPVERARAWLARHRPAYLGGDVPVAPSEPTSTVVDMENTTYVYGPQAPPLELPALSVRRGEVVVLEGPNGCGKTTLAKLAAGLLDAASGRIVRHGRAGYLSQDPGRYVVCEHALDEVALAVAGDRERARRALDAVGLGWAERRHPRDLSSGERERLGLAAVAVAEPDLLVLDEPTRGVDPERRHALGRALLAYAERGRGVLVATHDRSFPAHRRIALGRTEEVRVAA